MRIRILGPLEVAANGHIVEVGGARLRALLILLALTTERTVSAERLIDGLWDDDPPAAAVNALQSLVSRLRAVLGREAFESRPGTYRLLVPREAVDAHDFESRVARALRDDDAASRSAALRGALDLWRGPALEDVAGRPFAEGPAARLDGLRRTALDERIEADLRLGRHVELIPELQALTAADPLREPLRGKLMRALYAAGHQADALAEYTAARSALADALGVDPSPELENVYLAVLRQDPSLAAAPRPARPAPTGADRRRPAAPDRPPGTPDRAPGTPDQPQPSGGPEQPRPPGALGRPHGGPDRPLPPGASERPRPSGAADEPLGNLKARITSFVGRDDELSQVSELLAADRLVTLTGPGGAGKTRLSQEAGERWQQRVRDGVWFVEFAPVEDPAEVPVTVLTTLGVQKTVWTSAAGGRRAMESADPLGRLAAALATKRMVLVLDNCEHLLDATAQLAARLLADCPGVRILASSREPLGIIGETLWPVDPLELPPPEAGAVEALAYPAVRLLADRAAAVSRGFAVTDRNVASIAQICRALDGMPLAIELAAARLRSMTPAQVAARLNDRFGLLAGGNRAALPRHQTLRAVVEWSWDLLDEAERAMWSRLAVFSGGATAESAEEVCAGPGLARSGVFDVLTALVDKSLVTVTETEHGPRYRMLETIRAYGLERLAEAGDEERTRRAYAGHFLDLAETAEPHLYRDEQLGWLRRLFAENDNIHAALRWAISVSDAVLAARICAALGWYWFMRGMLEESEDSVIGVLELPGLPEDRTTAVVLVLGAATLLHTHGETERVTAWLLEARRIRDLYADEPERLSPMLRATSVALDMYLEGWEESSVRAVEPLLDDADPWVRGIGYFTRGQFRLNYGHRDAGEADFARALECFRLTGDRWGLSFTLTSQAELAGRRGDHEEAVALYQESLRLNDVLGGGPTPVMQTHMKLANELTLLGEHDRAVKMLRLALREFERAGSPEGMAALHFQLAEIARHDGDHTLAARHLSQAQDLIATVSGPPHFQAMIFCSRALLDIARGDVEHARPLLAESLRCAVQVLDHPIVAVALVGHAALALAESDFEKCALLLGAADGLRGGPDASFRDGLSVEAAARAALGDAFVAPYERGRAWTFDDVLTVYSLERPTSPGEALSG
ncbi:BTAD domain-containing putative transcriptional regulator [Spirillospora sp. NPDC047279]|uniref:AfsR/SARP family transcriptional regulator n=1 Tax=Spirillospora sp. NPDC047279 TaxID=3155478 RepID=UPI0033C6505B